MVLAGSNSRHNCVAYFGRSNSGYQCTLAEDGHTIRWSHPVDSFLLSMDHLKGIIGDDYSESNIRVRLFNNILQAMHHDKIEPDTNGLFWGNPTRSTSRRTSQEPLTAMTFCTGRRVLSPTMVIVKIQVADARRTITRGKRVKPVNLYLPASRMIVLLVVAGTTIGAAAIARQVALGAGSARRPRRRARTSTSGGFIVIHFLFTYYTIE